MKSGQIKRDVRYYFVRYMIAPIIDIRTGRGRLIRNRKRQTHFPISIAVCLEIGVLNCIIIQLQTYELKWLFSDSLTITIFSNFEYIIVSRYESQHFITAIQILNRCN
jgi:hypothetical protein